MATGILLDADALACLSPEARREVLALVGVGAQAPAPQNTPAAARKGAVRVGRETGRAWDPDADEPYPLGPREAKELVRGLSQNSREILRAFCQNRRDGVGRATLAELLRVTGHEDAQRLMKAIPGITRRLRTVTGEPEAWLLDWNDEDWTFDPVRRTYSEGAYYIVEPSLSALSAALGLGGTQPPDR